MILHNTLHGADVDRLPRPGRRARRRRAGAAAHERRPGTSLDLADRRPAAASGGTITYTFIAATPAPSSTSRAPNPEKQVRMGLFGALIVRPRWARTTPTTAPTAGSPPSRGVHGAALGDRPVPAPGGRGRARPSTSTTTTRATGSSTAAGSPTASPTTARRGCPTQPYGALASGQAVRRDHAPAARHGALPQRRHRGLPVPPARQQRARDRPRRPPARGHRRRRTCRSRSSPSTSARGRPGTCSSSGTTPRTTSPTQPGAGDRARASPTR